MLQPWKLNQFPEVRVDLGSAYELILHIAVVTEPEKDIRHFEIGRTRIRNMWMQVSAHPHLHDLLVSFRAENRKAWVNLMGLVYECPTPRDVPSLLAYIEATAALEVRLHLMGYYMREIRRCIAPDVILRAAEGDAAAQKQYLTTFHNDSHCCVPGEQVLSLSAEATKKLVLDVLRCWYEVVFCEQEERTLEILQRDAQSKRALKRTVSPARLIEVATSGFEYIPEPSVRTVLLVPALITRPYIYDAEYRDIDIYFCPVADESLVENSDVPPKRLVRLYKALADEKRLRILKLIAQKEYSLQEMAEEMGVAKSTLHHHFVILRSSGLLRVRTSDNRYRLREETFADIPGLLEAYLKPDVP